MNALHVNKCVNSLLPSTRHLITSCTSLQVQRNRLISFPERPAMENRYTELDAIKAMKLPPVLEPVAPVATRQPAAAPRVVTRTPVVEVDYVKSNGISVVFSDTVPDRFKRAPMSQEEIDHIMRGGPE